MPTGTPTAIIIPKFTPSILATNTEPADGGIKAKPEASPANSGIMNVSVDFFVFLASPNASGIRITTPASKKTVVPTIRPVIPSAQPAFFSPNLFIIV